MKLIVYLLLFIYTVFAFNIVLFELNDDYKFFIKKLKNNGEVVYVEKDKITDQYWELYDELTKQLDEIDDEYVDENNWEDIDEISYSDVTFVTNDVIVDETDKITWQDNFTARLTPEEENIYAKFQDYDLYKVNFKWRLFNLLDEHTLNYEEYAGEKFNLYFFRWDSYEKIINYIEGSSTIWLYEIKEVNNFWNKSFYINSFAEDYLVRIVIEYKWNIFGLSIDKSLYNEIKNILINNF